MGIDADSQTEEEVLTSREWLEDRRKIGMSQGLEVTYAMLTRLGMPQMAFPCVHNGNKWQRNYFCLSCEYFELSRKKRVCSLLRIFVVLKKELELMVALSIQNS